MSYHPHTQTLTATSIAVDKISGWHFPFLNVSGGIITSEITAQLLHVTGPATAEQPYGGLYSAVFDGGVHITGTGSTPFVSDGPIITNFDMLTPPLQGNYAATVAYVQSQMSKLMAVHLPVLGVFLVGNPNAPPYSAVPIQSDGDRIVTFSPGAVATNNHIWRWDDGSGLWVDTLEHGNGVAVATTRISDAIPGVPVFPANTTIIYSHSLDPLGTNDALMWTRWFLNFDHNYLAHNGYDPYTGVGITHATINTWLNQAVQTSSSPAFAGLSLSDTGGVNILDIRGAGFLSHQYNDTTLSGAYSATSITPPFSANNTWTLKLTVSGHSSQPGTLCSEQWHRVTSDAATIDSVAPIKSITTTSGNFDTASVTVTVNGTASFVVTVGGTAALSAVALWSVRVSAVSAH
jgi:hypothetical protein